MPSHPERVKKTLIILFGAWLSVVMILLTVTAVYEHKTYDLLGIIGILVYAGLFGLFWRYRSKLAVRLDAPEATLGRFVLIGWLTAIVVEILMYFTFSYQRGIGILFDLVYTSPMYLALLLAWWLALKKYSFSYREIFFLAGVNGLMIEQPQKVISGQSPLVTLITAPGHVFIYGSILLVPVALLGLAAARPDSSALRKYAFGLAAIPVVALPGYALSVSILALAGAG